VLPRQSRAVSPRQSRAEPGKLRKKLQAKVDNKKVTSPYERRALRELLHAAGVPIPLNLMPRPPAAPPGQLRAELQAKLDEGTASAKERHLLRAIYKEADDPLPDNLQRQPSGWRARSRQGLPPPEQPVSASGSSRPQQTQGHTRGREARAVQSRPVPPPEQPVSASGSSRPQQTQGHAGGREARAVQSRPVPPPGQVLTKEDWRQLHQLDGQAWSRWMAEDRRAIQEYVPGDPEEQSVSRARTPSRAERRATIQDQQTRLRASDLQQSHYYRER
jgi:hypothetical protein